MTFITHTAGRGAARVRDRVSKHPPAVQLDMIARRFKIFSEPMRLRLIYALREKELPVQKLIKLTGGNRANISKHLAVLLETGIVSRRRKGTTMLYSLADHTVFKLSEVALQSLHSRLDNQAEAIGAQLIVES